MCNLKHGLSFQSNFPGISELNRKVDMGVRIHFTFVPSASTIAYSEPLGTMIYSVIIQHLVLAYEDNYFLVGM